MNTRNPSIALSVVLLFTTLSPALAADCKAFQAEIIATSTSVGCLSPIGQCNAGTIDGNRRLQGTTFFTTQSFAPGPASAPNAMATVSYSGTLQITTPQGALTATDTGILDASVGMFSSFDAITGGSGRFQGASGTFHIRGRTVNGKFVSELSGELCLP